MKASAGEPRRDCPLKNPAANKKALLSSLRGGKGSFELFGKVIKRIPNTDVILVIGKRFSGGDDNAAAVGTFDGKGYGGLFMQRLHYRIGKIGAAAGIYDNIAGVSGYFGDGWLPEFFDLGIISIL